MRYTLLLQVFLTSFMIFFSERGVLALGDNRYDSIKNQIVDQTKTYSMEKYKGNLILEIHIPKNKQKFYYPAPVLAAGDGNHPVGLSEYRLHCDHGQIERLTHRHIQEVLRLAGLDCRSRR